MEAIKLFGKATCHKSRFYAQWLNDNNIPYDFYELENDAMNQDFLAMFHPNGERHFPTIVIGNRTFRNPSVSKMDKYLITAGVEQLEEGYSEVFYKGQRHSVTKEVLNGGKSVKVYAENRNGGDFISFNLYRTKAGIQLRPCEMPEQKIIDFLKQFEHTNEGKSPSPLKKGKTYDQFRSGNISKAV